MGRLRHGSNLEELVQARLRRQPQRPVVPDDPAVIVDPAHRVRPVAGLDVEEVGLHRGAQAVAPRDQQQRSAQLDVPDEIAPNRTTELEPVAFRELIDQVRRDLPTLNPLDGKRHPIRVIRC